MQFRYSLLDSTIPVFTTKRVFWKGVLKELIWFINGSTNSKLLSDEGVHIWDQNGSRQFLDSLGFLDRNEGDLGPVYGFQWRHFGAEYKDCNSDYSGQGIDQLQWVLNEIKNNPTSRRIIMTSWNPCDLKKMALPPCHTICQFYVSKKKYLSCQLYQRSADMGLGVPFNVASYSLLTHILAKLSNLEPLEFIHTLGDAHVYKNHIEALNQQCERRPKTLPKIEIELDGSCSLDDISEDRIHLKGYEPLAPIKMEMAV